MPLCWQSKCEYKKQLASCLDLLSTAIHFHSCMRGDAINDSLLSYNVSLWWL